MNRLAGRPFPDDHGFALIGDANGGDIAGTRAHRTKSLNGAAHLAGEDFRGVVLDPARLRVELLELVLRYRGNGAVFVKKNRARAGGALIERKNVTHGWFPPFGNQSNTRGVARARKGNTPVITASRCYQLLHTFVPFSSRRKKGYREEH